MDERRIELALNRIEAAFGRIEKGATEALERRIANGPDDKDMRQRVGAALAELDDLIAGLEE